jgi:hypothetical protein
LPWLLLLLFNNSSAQPGLQFANVFLAKVFFGLEVLQTAWEHVAIKQEWGASPAPQATREDTMTRQGAWFAAGIAGLLAFGPSSAAAETIGARAPKRWRRRTGSR